MPRKRYIFSRVLAQLSFLPLLPVYYNHAFGFLSNQLRKLVCSLIYELATPLAALRLSFRLRMAACSGGDGCNMMQLAYRMQR
jgi:hypothetical protein